ncbi:hypothetical protein ACJIZ3_017919 [Penstemon smallii]|uniref:Exostosin GT47 domain-containing protein n=1 Tax=Penstemon smallii TaxID=265156 RepID=A0ABD3SY85_9LAMI
MFFRPRIKFWFLFFIIFIFWYFLLYGFNWSYLPGLSSSTSSIPVNPNTNFSNDIIVDTSNNSSIQNNATIEDLESLQIDLDPIIPNKEQENHHTEIERVRERCTGRYIYVHDIPTKFNDDLIKNCKSLNKWEDMCQYFENMGLGMSLGNPQRLFLHSGWHVTHQFSLEVIFHQRMKHYDCLTNNSAQASAIFVPYYSGLDVARYLWGNYNYSTRDKDSLELFKWLREKPEWDVMNGKDHFMVAGRITWDFRRGIDEDSGWGNKLMLIPESQNMTILTIESSPWNKNDFAIPYPTYFHPTSDEQVQQWQGKMRKQRRKSLFCFAGAPRPDMDDSIRGEIMEQCTSSGRKCRMLECKSDKHNCLKPVNVIKMFQNSIFCLQPPGDSFTRRSTFDSILAGCIPVFFNPGSAYVQYLWHLPKNYGRYSVLIPEGDVKRKKVSIERFLERISRRRVLAMRDEVIDLIPKVVYADPRSRLEGYEDAFDLTINGVLERIEVLKREMREGKSYSDEFDEEYSWKYYTFGRMRPHEWDHYFNRTNRIKL